MLWPTTWIWEMSLSALLLSILVLESLRLADNPNWKAWARFGLIWGIAALTNPALLAFLPAAGLYPAHRLWRNGQAWLRPASTAALVFALCIAPWLVRNRVAFGEWIFHSWERAVRIFTGQLSSQQCLGWYGKHPSENKFEMPDMSAWVRSLTSPRRSGRAGFREEVSAANSSISAPRVWWLSGRGAPSRPTIGFAHGFFEPLAALCCWAYRRSAYGAEGAWLFFWLMFCYPFTYYLVFTQPRYRHAIEPEMLLLGTYFVSGDTGYSRAFQPSGRFRPFKLRRTATRFPRDKRNATHCEELLSPARLFRDSLRTSFCRALARGHLPRQDAHKIASAFESRYQHARDLKSVFFEAIATAKAVSPPIPARSIFRVQAACAGSTNLPKRSCSWSTAPMSGSMFPPITPSAAPSSPKAPIGAPRSRFWPGKPISPNFADASSLPTRAAELRNRPDRRSRR